MNYQVSPEQRLLELTVADAQPLCTQAVEELKSRIRELKDNCSEHCFDALRRIPVGSFHCVTTAAQTALENQDLLILLLQGGDPIPGRISFGNNNELAWAQELRRRLSLVSTALTVLLKSLSTCSVIACEETHARFQAMFDFLDEKPSACEF
jgi:hypothetical protein